MFDSAKLMYSSGEGPFYDYPIDGSLRFNFNDDPYLSRTPASAGNRQTWTFSCWFKRGLLNTYTAPIFGSYNAGTGTTGYFIVRFLDTDEKLQILANASSFWSLSTDMVFRDPSAWYHLVVAVDVTQATGSDRLKIYVNGEEVSYTFSSGTYPAQNTDLGWNYTHAHYIGANQYGGQRFDGHITEVNFIDGTALDATSFGEEISGVWKPIEYTGSYGTNGFYLPLTTDANDASGEDNHWIANNLASTDYVLDSPTNNFATLNPLDVGGTATFSEGNLKYNTAGTTWTDTRASMGISSGKWYWETNVLTVATFRPFVGIINTAARLASNGGSGTEQLGETTNSYAYWVNGAYLRHNATSLSPSPTAAVAGDIVQIALDMDNGNIWFGLNNTWYNSGNPSAGTGATWSGITLDEVAPAFETYSTTSSLVANFGQDSSFAGNKTAQGNTDDNGYGDFYYAPPTGYLALCTANLEVPDAMNPALDASPQDHFNTLLWTGDGASTRSLTGVGFQPDFVWTKARNYAYDHPVYDSIRGATKVLWTSSTAQEYDSYSAGYLTSFDADGFSVSAGSSNDNYVNDPAVNYVAWNWKANGSGVSNTDGSITSTVSANTDAGFSIVSWVGDGLSSGKTVGHGLNQAPEITIQKSRNSSSSYLDDWVVYTTLIDGTLDFLYLNTTGSKLNSGFALPTSTVFTPMNADVGDNMIAYCFHSVEGFSKFGSYTGNGSTDGTFVYTGFRPALIIIKTISTADRWVMFDSARSEYNAVLEAQELNPNDSSAEGTSTTQCLDFLSNGFKLRRTGDVFNNSGRTYIYMAFAETPFKYSVGR